MERKKRKNKSISGKLLAVIFAISAILTLSGFIMPKGERIFEIITLCLGGVYVAYKISKGLIKSPKRLEDLWILISLGILLFLERYREAQISLSLYLLFSLIMTVFLERIKNEGKDFMLDLEDFESERFIKINNLIAIPISLILAIAVFFINKNSVEVMLYAFSLSLIAFSTAFFYDLIKSLRYLGMIKLAKSGIYINDSKKLSNKFYDNIIMEDEGIITDGKYEVLLITPAGDYSKDEIKELMAYAFYNSYNPMREVILKAYGKKVFDNLISEFKEEDGISLTLAEDNYRVGELNFIKTKDFNPTEPDSSQLIFYIMKNGEFIGSMELCSHMREELTNPVEILKSSYTSKLLCFSGTNPRLLKRVASGLGLSAMEVKSAEEKEEIFKNLTGEILYIDALDYERTFDVSDYPNITFAHIGENISGELDYDIWIPEGSANDIVNMLEEGENFSSMMNRAIFLYAAVKIILFAFILSSSINAPYIIFGEILLNSIAIALIFNYYKEQDK